MQLKKFCIRPVVQGKNIQENIGKQKLQLQ